MPDDGDFWTWKQNQEVRRDPEKKNVLGWDTAKENK